MRIHIQLLTLVGWMMLAKLSMAGEPHAYRAARLWPGNGPVITDAALVVRDGKVIAAGARADVNIPADAVIHDLGDAVIIPGLVVAETTIADKGRDDLHAVTPHYRAVDGFDPFADYSTILAGGVTTVQIAPGSKRMLPGQGSVVKLHGDDLSRRLLREEESLRVVLGDAIKNPPRIYEPPVGAVSVDRPVEPTRPQLAGGFASAISGLRATFQAARADRNSTDPLLRAVATAGTASKPLRVTATTNADVQAALGIAKEFDLRLILVDPPIPTSEQMTAWKAHVVGVVLNPGVRPGIMAEASGGDDAGPAVAANRRRRPNPTPVPTTGRGKAASASKAKSDPETHTGSPAEAARDLRAIGIRVSVKPLVDADIKEMLYVGGLMTTHNSTADALKMVTADAATMLNVSDRVGTLEAGKDADFVVLSGDPFGLHTRIKAVFVDGHQAHQPAAVNQQKVIRGARLLTGDGSSIANGAVLVDGSTIRAVGRDVSTPADAEERRFADAVIVPGFLDLGNGLGLGGPLSNSVPLNTKLGSRLVSSEPAAMAVRNAGITTVLLAGPAPSPVLAFKLADKLRPLADPVALRFSVRGNLTSAGASLRETLRAGKAYFDVYAKYEADLKEYELKKSEYDASKPKESEKKSDDSKDEKKPDEKSDEKKSDEPKAPTKPQVNEAMEPYKALFGEKIPAMIEVEREDAIRLAVTICRDEFNIRTILIGADDAWRVADLLAEKSVAVVAGPNMVRTIDRNEVNVPMSMAIRGVPIGFQSQATGGAKNLPLAVGFAVRHGLGGEDALRGLCAGPAQFLGLSTVGSLAVGKEADLVVLSGMPFELSTRVLAVMIDGQWVYREGD